jgi:chorismate mutase
MALRAIRGAVTLSCDSKEEVINKVQQLLNEIFRCNCITKDDIISIIFSATPDITCMYPATAARLMGLDDVALFGAQELFPENAMPLCIRVLIHTESSLEKSQIKHVYLGDAAKLRNYDLNK